MASRRGRAATTVFVTLALAVSACGSSGKSGAKNGGGGASGTPSASAAARTASDVGVTADSIKLGFILTDLAQTKKLLGDVGPDKAVQQASYQAFVDEINNSGGINGRKVEPVFTSFDPVKGDAETQCTKLTEDDKVFAVISNGIFGAPVLCVTQQHKTPLINDGGYNTEYYQKSSGLLFTVQPSKAREVRNTVAALEKKGALQGKTIGVFTSQAGDDDISAKTALVPAIKQLGHKLGQVSDLSADTSTALSQVPVSVNQMRASGANVVFLSTNAFFASLFVQKADEQGYRPTYALADADNILDYFVAKMPASFKGTGYTNLRIGEQRVGDPEPATDADCRSVVEKSTGKKLTRGNDDYESAMVACNAVRLFARGAKAGGTTLTRTSWVKGMDGLGTFPLAYSDNGSFSPTKTDAADYIAPADADVTCKCWIPKGPFEKMQY